jgi:hypothetical protein
VDFALLYQPVEAMAASSDYFTYVITVRHSLLAEHLAVYCRSRFKNSQVFTRNTLTFCSSLAHIELPNASLPLTQASSP